MAKEGSRQNQLILDQGVALERQVAGLQRKAAQKVVYVGLIGLGAGILGG